MKVVDYLYLAKKDLFNYKLRSGLIIGCICVGVLSSTLNLYHTSKRQEELISSLTNIGSQMVSIWIMDREIGLKDIAFLSDYFPHIAYQISSQKDIKYLRRERKNVSVVGTVPEYKTVHSLKLKSGRFILPGDIKGKRQVCVLDSSISDELRIRVGEKIKIGENRFRVIGIGTNQEWTQYQVIIPLSICNDVLDSTTRNLEVVILTDGKPDVLQDEIRRILKCRFPDKKVKKKDKQFNFDTERFMVSTAEGLLEMIKKQRWISRMIVLGIGLATLILAGNGIMNMIMLAVRQQVKEIGIMRAVGGRRNDILYLFMLEGALLSFYGLLSGIFLATSYIGLAGGCKIDIFLESLLWSGVICVLISFSGYYPASRATKISPCEAIREGIKG